MTKVHELEDLSNNPFFGLFEGARHGDGMELSFFVGHVPPGLGPRLHKHPYAEAFVLHEGEATFTAGDDELVARGGQIVVVPPETPHKLVSSGEGNLLMVSIHPSREVVQTDLEE